MRKQEMSANGQNEPAPGISRRELLVGLSAAAVAAYAGTAASAMPGHDHSKHAAQQPSVLNATNECLDMGQRCIAHCLVSFKEGDLSLAVCAAKVHEMQAICGAYSYLLSANSTYIKEYTRVCKTACKDCAKECRKHEEHHECRACAEACEKLVKAIEKAFG